MTTKLVQKPAVVKAPKTSGTPTKTIPIKKEPVIFTKSVPHGKVVREKDENKIPIE